MFQSDFNRANSAIEPFLELINSNLKGLSNGYKIISIEKSNNQILQIFDKYSGIDAIQLTNDEQVRTIALRVQFGRAFDTFTIRYKRSSGAPTEYEKRLNAIKNEKLYPNITMQCYIVNNQIDTFGAIYTKELYRQITEHPEITKINVAHEDNNSFLYISFYDLDNILIYKNNKATFYKTAFNKQAVDFVDVSVAKLAKPQQFLW